MNLAYSADKSYVSLLKDLKTVSKPHISEINALIATYKTTKNQKYLDEIIYGSMDFILHKAKSYSNSTLTPSDLISCGIIGVKQAISKFDHTKNVHFFTYAQHWIEMYMRKEVIRNKSIVRVTVRAWEHSTKIYMLRKDGNNDKQIMDKMCIHNTATLQKCRNVHEDISLNEPTQKDNGFGEFSESIYDIRDDPRQELIKSDYMNYVDKQLKKLPKRDLQILILRFGLSEQECKSLKDISSIFNISAERVRQIVDRTLKNLRMLMDCEYDYNSTSLVNVIKGLQNDPLT